MRKGVGGAELVNFLKVSKSKRKKKLYFWRGGARVSEFFFTKNLNEKVYFFHCVLFLFSGGRGEGSKVCEYSLRRIQI